MIKNTHFVLLIGFLLISLIAFSPDQLNAAQLDRFCDLDGDGFNDNAPDTDADGIPDELEPHGLLSAQMPAMLGVSMMFSGSQSPADKVPPMSPGQRFGMREFVTRAICVTRTNFDAGFSSGMGISGSGGGGGGACAGGVCF